MTENYLVSIVIPVYNSEKFLKECIESVINQSYKNIEIIIVDNCSSDSSFEIAKNYSTTDSRIKLLVEEHKSAMRARKTGIEYASGDYICSIDSDDYIDSEYIKTLLNNAIINDSDIVQCSFKCEGIKNDTYIFDEYNANIKDNHYDVLLKWLHGEMYFGSQLVTKLFKTLFIKNILSKINTNISEGEDKVFFLYYLKQANNISSVNDVLYHYRYRVDSLSHKINFKWLITELIMINKLTNIIRKEYPLLNKTELSIWKKNYTNNRMHDYIQFKKSQ